MRVLVTGANGFVGSHVVETLVSEGHTVVCLVRATSNCRWLENLRTERRIGDVTLPDSLAEAVKDADAVVHTAGCLRAARPDAYYQVNQIGTRNLARAVLRHNPGLKRFVYLSSQAAMGPSSGPRPKSPAETENPVSDYGKSKLAGERELAVLRGAMPCTVLRPASVYGPRDKDIFIFFQLVRYGFRPAPLRRRLLQLVFVKDVVRAVVASLERGPAGSATYFLAEETPYSWEEIGSTVAQAAGKRTISLPLPDLAFSVTAACAEALARFKRTPAVLNRQKIAEMFQPYWLGDPAPARKDLALDFTNLKIGAKITYLWYRENHWL